MVKDPRYNTIKKLISGNQIQNFDEIYLTVPKSKIAEDLGFNSKRINNLIENIEDFILRDLFKLAVIIEVDEIEIMKLVCNQYKADKKRKPKK